MGDGFDPKAFDRENINQTLIYGKLLVDILNTPFTPSMEENALTPL